MASSVMQGRVKEITSWSIKYILDNHIAFESCPFNGLKNVQTKNFLDGTLFKMNYIFLWKQEDMCSYIELIPNPCPSFRCPFYMSPR